MNIVQAWLIDMVIKGDSSQLRPGHTSSSSSSTVDRDRNLSQSWRTNTEEDLLESDHIHIEEPLYSSPLEADLVICDEPSTPNPELQSRTSIESEIDR
ncbi:hypothetical protein BASA81_014629 [Batrachochytrium salamandrivorans]|nr:hypothetical protein BASA81_014629 [Batrachochytrium salamandrivorans]